MNITVKREHLHPNHLSGTGGEYAIAMLEIYVDDSLPERTQQEMVIHSIIENYCRNWAHNNVEQLTEYIQEGLDQIKED